MARQFSQRSAVCGGKTLPLSTLLLAALCVLLAAPCSQASPQQDSRSAILSVLERSEISASLLKQVLAPQISASTELSILEVRKLRAALSKLDKSQLVELQKHLASFDALAINHAPVPLFDFTSPQTKYSSPAPHYAQQTFARIARRLE